MPVARILRMKKLSELTVRTRRLKFSLVMMMIIGSILLLEYIFISLAMYYSFSSEITEPTYGDISHVDVSKVSFFSFLGDILNFPDIIGALTLKFQSIELSSTGDNKIATHAEERNGVQSI